MNELRKAAEMALEALEWNYGTDLENIENCTAWLDKMNATIPALRQALAQPEPVCSHGVSKTKCDFCKPLEQEPVAWVYRGNFHPFDPSDWAKGETATPLYTAPPKREWVGLTDEEVQSVIRSGKYESMEEFARAIEAKLKEKNA